MDERNRHGLILTQESKKARIKEGARTRKDKIREYKSTKQKCPGGHFDENNKIAGLFLGF